MGVFFFSNLILTDCLEILRIRKENNLAHNSFHVPIICDETSGFHMNCYRRFTALGKKYRKEMTSPINLPTPVLLREKRTKYDDHSTNFRSGISPSSNNLVLFPKLCIFCDKVKLIIKGEKQKLTKVEIKDGGKFPFQENLSKYAEILNDAKMKARISDVNLGAKGAWYHRSCRRRYQHQAERVEEGNSKEKQMEDIASEWHQTRKLHFDVFLIIRGFVAKHIIESEEIYFSSELCNMYHSAMIKNGINEGDVSHRTQKLEKRLSTYFKDKIVIGPSGKGNIVHSSKITTANAIDLIGNNAHELEKKIRKVAFHLRNIIYNAKKRSLPEEIKLDDVLRGEIDIPDPLQSFFCHLVMGPRLKRGETERKKEELNS